MDGKTIAEDDGISMIPCFEKQVERNPEKQLCENDLDCVGSITKKKKLTHKQWRRYLKKIRRKSARQALAQFRERQEKEEQERKSQLSKVESEALEKLEEQWGKEETLRKEREHQQWLEREKYALRNISCSQVNLQDEVNENETVSEVELDTKSNSVDLKKELLKAELKKLEEQQKGKAPEQNSYHNPERPNAKRNLGDWNQTPNGSQADEKDQSLLHNPNNCNFFLKTGACKYGALCSRNHIRSENSSTIMIPNFFQNPRLEIPMLNEKCNDADIEYDEAQMMQDFGGFYDDVIEEFKNAGNVVMFKCCQNFVPHLRGNVYVQFSNPECALKAFRMFNGRYYAGRQLSVELSPVSNWRSAICGLFLKRCCPRGKACNFLHIFRNPANAYSNFDTDTVIKRMNEENNPQHRRDKSPRRKHTHSHTRSHLHSHSLRQSRSHSRSRSRSPRAKRYYSRRTERPRKSYSSSKSTR